MKTPTLIAEPTPTLSDVTDLAQDLPPQWMEMALQLYPALTAPSERMLRLSSEALNQPDYVLTCVSGINQP